MSNPYDDPKFRGCGDGDAGPGCGAAWAYQEGFTAAVDLVRAYHAKMTMHGPCCDAELQGLLRELETEMGTWT